MNNDASNPKDPVIIPSITVTTPLQVPNPEIISFSSNILVLGDMVMFRNDPLPVAEFRINLDSTTLRRSTCYIERYGTEFLNIPDDYFIYEGNIDTSRTGIYTVSVRIDPNGGPADIGAVLGGFICDSFLIVADSEGEAATLYRNALKLREKGNNLSILPGLFGFPPMYTSLLITAFQQVINNDLANAQSRQKLGLPQGDITRQELFIWARKQDGKKEFYEKIVSLVIGILPYLQEKSDKNGASQAERSFLEMLRNHIRQNRISAAIDAINGYNQWIRDDDQARRSRHPLLGDVFHLGNSRVPDTFLEEAMTGIPAGRIKNNVLAASIASAGAGLSVLTLTAAFTSHLTRLLPYTARLASVSLRAAGLIGGPIAIGLTVFAAVFSAAVEKIVHDGYYGKQLWKIYEDAQGEVRLLEMLKKEDTINILIANLLEMMMASRSIGAKSITTPTIPLLKEIHRPIR